MKMTDWTDTDDDDEYCYAERMKALEGKTVQKLYVTPGGEALVFDCGDVAIAYRAEGDCCSRSWFNDVDGVSRLLGATVTKTESVEMLKPDVSPAPHNDWCDDDCDYDHAMYEDLKAYGIKLTTTEGYVDIVFRNSSNGYYGGYLQRTNGKIENLREVTTDWTA
jgi:hypothetical protein